MARGRPTPRQPLPTIASRRYDWVTPNTRPELAVFRGDPQRQPLPSVSGQPSPTGPERPGELTHNAIYVLPGSEAYVVAAWWFDALLLHEDELRGGLTFYVHPDGRATVIDGSERPIVSFHIRELRPVPGAFIAVHPVCGKLAFPDHAEVCPGPGTETR